MITITYDYFENCIQLQIITITDYGYPRSAMLFRNQHGSVDVTFDYIQPNDTDTRGSQSLRQLQASEQLKTSTSSLFTPLLSVTGIDCLPLLPMSRLSRNLGKASQVSLPSSWDPNRLSHLYIVLTRDLGHFTCLLGIAVFTQGKLQSEKFTTLTVEEKEVEIPMFSMTKKQSFDVSAEKISREKAVKIPCFLSALLNK